MQKGLRGGDRESVGDARISVFAHPGGRNTQAIKARVNSGQFILNRSKVEEILMRDFTEFLVLDFARRSDNRHDALHVRIVKTFAQRALPDHSGCSEYDHSHLLPSAGKFDLRPDYLLFDKMQP